MKIVRVEAFPLGIRLEEPLRWGAMVVHSKGGIVVEVETDEGLVGLGEAGFSAEYFPTVGPIINQQLAPLLIGRDPLDLAGLWELMYRATHLWGRRGVETYAISGIDIALWDLLGKVTDQPLHRLLGSAKQEVRAYYAPSLKSPERMVPEARRAVEAGFTAIKLRVGLGVEVDQRIVADVRAAVGPAIDLMVDANMAYDRRTALRMAAQFEDLGVSWLEEPIRTNSLTQYIDEHTWLAERVGIRLAGGESLLTRFEYLDALTRHTFDVLQPDCTTVGGISEAKRVADMASGWNIECVPHIGCSSGTGIGLAAGLHLILACTNSPLVEYDAYGGPGWDGLLQEPITAVGGVVNAPTGPGLGVALAPDARDRFALG
ncbi:D-galactarolactone cycloisomerase [Micromonospora qiuiae]|uniref:D-galactarolactone cycloisomerase n=1 Tax=Micromonospora qiuiae TaxID=502268 RepID=A0ABQ4JIA6_9ACTN|nr:mandelate racemase/muconate lactonizing enzyme family protein [Micromonospora qiuiae]GIJ30317.1 D-galactarolactone cycloisomerase [Micromonospora qiuiae]